MKTVSIGFTRDDEDFQVLATLNNNDGLVDASVFHILVSIFRVELEKAMDRPLEVLERQDTPDYVSLD